MMRSLTLCLSCKSVWAIVIATSSILMMSPMRGNAADWNDGTFLYIANNHLYEARADGRGDAIALLRPSEFGDARGVTLNGLACGRGSDVLFFVTTIDFARPTDKPKSRIFSLDTRTKRLAQVPQESSLALGWPVLSGDGRRIAALAMGYGSPDALVIADLQTNSLKRYEIARVGAPRSWGPNDGELLATGLATDGKSWQIIALDPSNGNTRVVTDGGIPLTLNSRGLLAYLSVDQKTLVVSELLSGAPVAKFGGFYKDLVQWLDDDTVLFVSGVLYQDYLGTASLKSKKTSVVLRPARGEIHGACWIRKQ
jgi:hypothetical protein